MGCSSVTLLCVCHGCMDMDTHTHLCIHSRGTHTHTHTIWYSVIRDVVRELAALTWSCTFILQHQFFSSHVRLIISLIFSPPATGPVKSLGWHWVEMNQTLLSDSEDRRRKCDSGIKENKRWQMLHSRACMIVSERFGFPKWPKEVLDPKPELKE